MTKSQQNATSFLSEQTLKADMYLHKITCVYRRAKCPVLSHSLQIPYAAAGEPRGQIATITIMAGNSQGYVQEEASPPRACLQRGRKLYQAYGSLGSISMLLDDSPLLHFPSCALT